MEICDGLALTQQVKAATTIFERKSLSVNFVLNSVRSLIPLNGGI